MKILFAGGAEISVPALRVLSREYTVTAVLTHPDTTAGRGRKKKVNPVKDAAEALGLSCIETERIDDAVISQIEADKPDLLTVVAYGKLFPESFLSLFPGGGVNVHPSLLPKYRGPSPVTAAILNGDSHTGITVQCIEFTMDTGDILLQKDIPLDGTETTGSLLEQLAEPGAELLLRAIKEWTEGAIVPVPQHEEDATYCRLISKEDGLIDWNEDAVRIERMIRAYDPWPKAFTYYNAKKCMLFNAGVVQVPSDPKGKPGKVMGIDKKEGILIQTGSGVLAVRSVQLQAKKCLDWKPFINGHQQFIGSQLGQA